MSDFTYLQFHIEKCGGTSLIKSIEHRFKVYVFNRSTSLKHLQFLMTTKHFPQVVCGHQPFGIHYLIKRPWRTFTVLREPSVRFLSHVDHVRAQPRHAGHEAFLKKSSEEIAEEYPHYCNWFTRIFSGNLDGEIAKEDFRKAWHALCLFDKVYTLEDGMDRIVDDFRVWTGCQEMPHLHSNRCKGNREPSEKVKEANAWDTKLWKRMLKKRSNEFTMP